MIDVKQAAQAAISYVGELLGPLIDPRIEETEISEDGKHWYITVGFLRRNSTPPAVALGPRIADDYREYKQVTVRADDGAIDSMRIRKI